MLSMSPNESDASRFAVQTPLEYAALRKRQALALYKENFNIPGLSCDIFGDVFVIALTEPDIFIRYLVETEEVTRQDAERVAILFESATYSQIDAAKSARQTIRSIAESMLDRTGTHAERLREVPVDLIVHPYFNAGAGPAPGGGDIVLFTEGLQYLPTWLELWHMCRWSSENVDSEARTARLMLPLQAQLTASAQLESLPASFYAVSFATAQNGWLEQTIFMIAMIMMLQFVALHEFGHIALGHTDVTRNWRDERELSRLQLIERRRTQRNFEREADAFAAQFIPAPALYDDGRPAFELLIPALTALFAMFHLAEIRDGVSDDRLRTHPAASERLRDVLAPLVGESLAKREMAFTVSLAEGCTANE